MIRVWWLGEEEEWMIISTEKEGWKREWSFNREGRMEEEMIINLRYSKKRSRSCGECQLYVEVLAQGA